MKVYTYKVSENHDFERDLNIVIPTPSVEKELFKKAKKSVEENAKNVRVNIYLNAVVDSGPDFRFSRSVNRGLEEQDADFYLNMNDDVILEPDALYYGIKDFDTVDNLGLLGARLVYPNGKIQTMGLEFKKCSFFVKMIKDYPWLKAPRYSYHLCKLERKLILERANYAVCGTNITKPRPFKGVIFGAFHMFTREVLQKTGGYDENYKMGTEDIDFSLSVIKINKLIRVDQKISGVHYAHNSKRNYGVFQEQRKRYYYKKWSPVEIIDLVNKNGYILLK